MDFDEILAKCGNGHRYQYLLLGLYSFLMFVTAMQNFSQNIISFVPDHWCYHKKLENLSFSQINDIYSKLERPSCTHLATIDLEDGNVTVSGDRCDRWIYDYDFDFRSMNTELNWVCDAAYKAPVGQSFFFVGSMFGTLIFGILGDRIGRIKALILANWCGFLGDFATIFADNLTVFSITRFISGLAVDANSYLMYILILEYFSPSLRSYGLSISTCVSYGLGMVCSAWLAVFVGHWRIFLGCTSVPLLLVTLFYFFVQESSQWLITRNDIDGAVKRLERVAKFNRRVLSGSDIEAFRNHCQRNINSEEDELKIIHMFKTPHLRKTMIQMLIVFMIALVCFNTMSRNVEGQGISPFITFSMFALVLPIAGSLQAGIQKLVGRKGSSVGALILTGIFTAASGIVLSLWDEPSIGLLVAFSVVARFGISVCFGSTLLFSSELVPTCIRSRGLAMAHIAGAALSLLSPYILHLGTFYRSAPSIILCVLLFLCAYVGLLLPETSNRKLPITLSEGEEFGKGERMFDFLKTSKAKNTTKTESNSKKCTDDNSATLPA
ncbi:hypothetical protein KR222_004470 [Zaprionus bogoriensis]|nr:hypothetical protein KR222_004470 [Zaprionus bogoriensis]